MKDKTKQQLVSILKVKQDTIDQQVKVLDEYRSEQRTKLKKVLSIIDKHGNDKGSKLDKVTLLTCRRIVDEIFNNKID